MPWVVSLVVSTALSLGAQNEGQPEPLSYLVDDSNSGWPQPAQWKMPFRFSMFSGLENGTKKKFGHVGFLSKPPGTPDPEGGSKKGLWVIGGNQKPRDIDEEKGAVNEKFYPASNPTLEVLDIVKTTHFA